MAQFHTEHMFKWWKAKEDIESMDKLYEAQQKKNLKIQVSHSCDQV